jgi:hypothetical protein
MKAKARKTLRMFKHESLFFCKKKVNRWKITVDKENKLV